MRNQNYPIPAGTDIARYNTVLVLSMRVKFDNYVLKTKTSDMIEEDLDVEPELGKVQEPVTLSINQS